MVQGIFSQSSVFVDGSDKLKEREKKERKKMKTAYFFIEDFTIQGKIGIRCWFAGIIDSQLRGDSVCLMQMTNH